MKNLLLLTLLFSNFALADTDNKIDAELNVVYKAALQNNPNSKVSIIKAQRLWLKFIAADCDLYVETNSGNDPHIRLFEHNLCISQAKAVRVNFIKETLLD